MKNKIIIVGGTGFLGFHLAKYYLKNNWQVLSISRKNPKKIRYLKSVNYLFVDIGDKKKLFTILKKHSNTDCIVNFSGEVDHSNSKKVFKSHYLGLKNLAEFFVNKPLKKFVQIGSSLEYGKKTSPQRENFKANPKSNYSKAKFLSTNFLIKLYKTKKLPVIILRPYQVYGPHQDINRLIPIVIQNCLKNKKFPCSNGLQYRDVLYVEEKNITAEDLKLIKKGFPEFGKIKLRNEENIVTYPNIEKARKLIGWKPKINFNNGIKKTIKYYKNN